MLHQSATVAGSNKNEINENNCNCESFVEGNDWNEVQNSQSKNKKSVSWRKCDNNDTVMIWPTVLSALVGFTTNTPNCQAIKFNLKFYMAALHNSKKWRTAPVYWQLVWKVS